MTASSVALGVMRMDSLDLEEAVMVVNSAVDHGVDFFDTADIYGFSVKHEHGSSEIFGEALEKSAVDRGTVKIQTKVGIKADYTGDGRSWYDFSKERIINQLDAELAALRTDYVDSLLLHRPDVLAEPDEIASAFNQLYAQGKVRHFGVSNMSSQMIEYVQRHLDQRVEFNQLQFSMTHTGLLDEQEVLNTQFDSSPSRTSGLLPYMAMNDIVLQAWSPFQSGTEHGAYIGNDHYSELNAELRKVADAHHASVNAIATAWMLRLPLPVQVIAGTMNPQRLAEIADGMGIVLDRPEWYGLYKAAGHILP
jgi:predicted oxidoreductase